MQRTFDGRWFQVLKRFDMEARKLLSLKTALMLRDLFTALMSAPLSPPIDLLLEELSDCQGRCHGGPSYGTSTLIALWVIGSFLFAIEFLAHIEIWPSEEAHNQTHEEGNDSTGETVQQAHGFNMKAAAIREATRHTPYLVYDGTWPHEHFNPRDIACHESIGDSIFVIEKYAVHQLNIKEGASVIQPALEKCLSEDHEFRYHGLQSISIHCAEADACHAMLFSASGLGALRCPLSHQDNNQAQRVLIRGKNWRSVTGSDAGAWALNDRNMLVRLGQHAFHADELMPQYEVMRDERLAKIERLHVSPDGRLLGLEPEGWLHSWPLGRGDPQTLPLPAHLRTRWAGVCSTGSAIYFAGVDKRGAGASIWRMRPRVDAHASALV